MIGVDLWVEIFEWPSRFFVETDEKDRALIEIFNDPTPYPFLVDIDEPNCPCYDYQQNILKNEEQRLCKHLIAATRYRWLMGEKPKSLPSIKI